MYKGREPKKPIKIRCQWSRQNSCYGLRTLGVLHVDKLPTQKKCNSLPFPQPQTAYRKLGNNSQMHIRTFEAHKSTIPRIHK